MILSFISLYSLLHVRIGIVTIPIEVSSIVFFLQCLHCERRMRRKQGSILGLLVWLFCDSALEWISFYGTHSIGIPLVWDQIIDEVVWNCIKKIVNALRSSKRLREVDVRTAGRMLRWYLKNMLLLLKKGDMCTTAHFFYVKFYFIILFFLYLVCFWFYIKLRLEIIMIIISLSFSSNVYTDHV